MTKVGCLCSIGWSGMSAQRDFYWRHKAMLTEAALVFMKYEMIQVV